MSFYEPVTEEVDEFELDKAGERNRQALYV
jgi:hypothetical protein